MSESDTDEYLINNCISEKFFQTENKKDINNFITFIKINNRVAELEKQKEEIDEEISTLMSIQTLPGRQQKSREERLNKPFIKTVEKLAPELNKLKENKTKSRFL